jgi:hypothetical protein
MTEEPFVPYQVILANGPLSSAEDLATAIVPARQAQAFGQLVQCIKKGAKILEGEQLSEAIGR